jgi:cytochrome c oxidase cbb3-type subunit I/II
MATFEGPLLTIKSVNALGHFTDWIVGHVHSGTIGWNYMLTAGMLYYLVPRLWKTEVYSWRLANWQFWTATFGLLLYIMSMWVAGITQGLMWRAIDESGRLVYPNFVETVVRIIPMYWVRAVGGVFVLSSFVMMIINLWKTIRNAPKNAPEDVYRALPLTVDSYERGASSHRKLEGMPMIFSVLAGLAVLVGSIIEIVPSLVSSSFVEKNSLVKPYTPLEVLGRDIYVKEGCYVCHSQMIRPMAAETLRYGKPSEASESVYDRPFQWGSRRIGPDLARVGGKYPDMWHFRHMINPREVTPGSIMPNYKWLISEKIDWKNLTRKMSLQQSVGVPYTDLEIEQAEANAKQEALKIATGLKESGVDLDIQDKEIVALIAYLQKLGRDLGGKE